MALGIVEARPKTLCYNASPPITSFSNRFRVSARLSEKICLSGDLKKRLIAGLRKFLTGQVFKEVGRSR